MIEQQNFKELEKSLYSKFQEDGIWDLFLGLFLLAIGLLMEFSNTTYIVIVVGVMIPFVYGMKKKITKPRLGVVTFSKKRQMKEQSSYLSIGVIFILLFLLSSFFIFKSPPTNNSLNIMVADSSILLALVFTLVLAAVAYLYGIMRFVWYAVMLFLLFSLGGLARLNPSYMFIVSGSLIFINGAKLLSEFIKKYPKQDNVVESNGV